MPHISAPISPKRLLRQYLRWLPAQLGLINKGAFLLQLNKINADDVFLVSYPKSGNTWLRYIIAYLTNGTVKKLSLADVELLVPDVYISKDVIDAKQKARIIKTHDPLFSYYPKVIYIHRDYRDVLVAYYRHKTLLGEYKGTFSDFIRSAEVNEPFGTWASHVNAALERSKKEPADILILSYENLHYHFEREVEKIAEFLKISSSVDLKEIKASTQIDELRQTEDNEGSWFKKLSGDNFFNKGSIGQWKLVFSQDDIEYLKGDDKLVQVMMHLKYTW